ncbi:unnamed protein product, partial [Pylaiella littoralis]
CCWYYCCCCHRHRRGRGRGFSSLRRFFSSFFRGACSLGRSIHTRSPAPASRPALPMIAGFVLFPSHTVIFKTFCFSRCFGVLWCRRTSVQLRSVPFSLAARLNRGLFLSCYSGGQGRGVGVAGGSCR